MNNASIRTDRLDLVTGTVEILEAELAGRARLQERLGSIVPESWPPPLYDEPAVRWTLERIQEDREHEEWGFRYFVLRQPGDNADSIAVGAGGFKGPPEDGSVEIGYSVLQAYQRRGIATEAARGMVTKAFADERVAEVIGETLPELIPSIGVLEKLGFQLAGTGSEEGVIRFRVGRETFISG